MEYLAMNDRIPGTTWDNPIWYRGKWRIYLNNYDVWTEAWTYCHDDYDGAADSGDHRYGYAATEAACKAEIDERFYE